jgi:predicted negative regulator of RcsB-dependent stress response
MERCAINFIARHWWRRAEVWVIAILLVTGGLTLGWQAGVWSASSESLLRCAPHTTQPWANVTFA